MTRIQPAIFVLFLFVASTPAATVAHWRFNEGVVNTRPLDSANNTQPNDVILDSSGNGNHLRTYADFSAPLYVSDVPAALLAQTGETNNLAFQFVPNQDCFSEGKPINSVVFSAWTVEASVKLNAANQYQAFVVKDGNAGGSFLPPLVLKCRGDNNLFQIEVVDGSGAERTVLSTVVPTLGKWYHLAAVDDGVNLSFYIRPSDAAAYQLQGSVPVTGSWYDNGANDWSVGRGWYNGIADWVNGKLDEIRVSDTALKPEEFLFASPRLTVVRLSGQARLSWPVAARGFDLESTTALSPSANWTVVTNVPVVLGTERVVTNTITTNRFYRLRSHSP